MKPHDWSLMSRYNLSDQSSVQGSVEQISHSASNQLLSLLQDSPTNKLLYAKEIPEYKKRVQCYYRQIQEMAPLSEQEMNAHLAEESRVSWCCLKPWYTRAKNLHHSSLLSFEVNYKYRMQLTKLLEESQCARHACHLQYTLEKCQNAYEWYECAKYVYLQRISELFLLQKYRNEFNTNLALTEVYKYAKKYRSQVSLSSCRCRHCPVRVWACRWTDGSSFMLWIELVWHERAITWGFAKQCWWLWMCSVHFTAWVWKRRLVFGFSGTFLSVRELWFFLFFFLAFCCLNREKNPTCAHFEA